MTKQQCSAEAISSQQQKWTHLIAVGGAWQRLALLQAVAYLRCRKRRGVQELAEWQLWTACQRPGTCQDLQAGTQQLLAGQSGQDSAVAGNLGRTSWQPLGIKQCFPRRAGHRGHSKKVHVLG